MDVIYITLAIFKYYTSIMNTCTTNEWIIFFFYFRGSRSTRSSYLPSGLRGSSLAPPSPGSDDGSVDMDEEPSTNNSTPPSESAWIRTIELFYIFPFLELKMTV